MTVTFLTYADLMKLTGIRSRTTIFKRVQRGDFPPPLELSHGVVRFRKSEVLAWIDSLPLQHY